MALSSASSKTAYGTAFCLAPTVKIVGLTSPGNLAFTQGPGCYDDLLTYDDVARLSAESPTVYVDFSGSVEVRANVHRHLGNRLTYSCSVGATHWEALGSGKGLPGPRPVPFFAPAQIKKRNADWSAAGLQQRIAEAWAAFMHPATDPQHPWLRVVRGRGAAAVEATYAALLAGTVSPSEGQVLAV